MYMQRTTSGSAGNGLYISIKYMRGAAGIGLGTTIKYLRRTTSGAAGNGLDVKSPSLRRGYTMRFQKSHPVEASTYVSLPASTGPLKNMDASPPELKAHAHKIH
jgi:hypothetical protein